MYEVHPLSLCLPPMEDNQYRDLVESIRENGLRKRIVLFQGKILMGSQRARACKELGIDPEYEEFTGTLEEAVEAVKIEEIFRRHASPSQRAMALEALKAQGHNINGGASDRTRGYARAVIKNGAPELAQAVLDGVVSASDAAKALNLPKAEQAKLATAVKTGKAKNIKQAKTKPKGDAWEDEEDTDAYGTVIPPALKDAFATPILTDAISSLRSALNAINGTQSWHPFILIGSLRSDLERVMNSLTENAPAAVCQDCSGVGCRECRGCGWLPRWRVDEIGYQR